MSINALSIDISTLPKGKRYTSIMEAAHFKDDTQDTINTIAQTLDKRANDIIYTKILKNARDEFGRTAIWLAALGGKKMIYNYLLSRGADPDIKSTSGEWAGFSARELYEMSPEEIEAARNVGAKTKL